MDDPRIDDLIRLNQELLTVAARVRTGSAHVQSEVKKSRLMVARVKAKAMALCGSAAVRHVEVE